MYRIRGGDQKEYGPVSGDVLKRWIAEGRANGQTPVLAEGTTLWKPLSSYPELSTGLGPAARPSWPGTVMPTLARTGLPATATTARTSGLAVASLILGAVGCLGITALVGLVLGVVSWVNINRSQGRLGGRGLAVAGVCLSGFMLVAFTLWAGVTLPGLASSRGNPTTLKCQSQVKRFGLGLKIYANDNRDSLPNAANWCDAIQEIMGGTQSFRCPGDRSSQRCSYAFNRKLSGLKLGNVHPRTVMIFECQGGWNVSGGPAQMISRHGRVYTVGLAGGAVEVIPSSRLSTLRWDP